MVRPKIALLSLAGTSMGVVSPQMIRSAPTPSRWRRVILATALAAAALGLAASSDAAEEHKRRPAAAPAVQRGPAAVNRPGRLVRPLPNQRPGLIAPNIGGRGNVAQPLPNQRPGLIAPHIGGRGNVAQPLPNGPVHRPAVAPLSPRVGGFRAPNHVGVGPAAPAGARFGGPQSARPGLAPRTRP